MVKKEVILINETGLHARPASLFVKEAGNFTSDIRVIKAEKSYNAKSIMAILSMGASKGDRLIIQAEGHDESQVVEALVKLVSGGFND